MVVKYSLESKPNVVAGELNNFYSGVGLIKEAGHVERIFQNTYRSIVARDSQGSIVGAIRSSFDGVYVLIWDLKVNISSQHNSIYLKSTLLSEMVNGLLNDGHRFIAAIVPDEEINFYRGHGLPYGEGLVVTTIEHKNHIIWKSPHQIRRNDQVESKELSRLFKLVGWEEEAVLGEQFAQAFNEAVCNFTARDDQGSLMGIIRAHFDGRIAMRWNLVVHPHHRNQGLGFKLLSNLLQFIIDSGYESYGLAVKPMVKHYQKLAIQPAIGKQVATSNPRL